MAVAIPDLRLPSHATVHWPYTFPSNRVCSWSAWLATWQEWYMPVHGHSTSRARGEQQPTPLAYTRSNARVTIRQPGQTMVVRCNPDQRHVRRMPLTAGRGSDKYEWGLTWRVTARPTISASRRVIASRLGRPVRGWARRIELSVSLISAPTHRQAVE